MYIYISPKPRFHLNSHFLFPFGSPFLATFRVLHYIQCTARYPSTDRMQHGSFRLMEVYRLFHPLQPPKIVTRTKPKTLNQLNFSSIGIIRPLSNGRKPKPSRAAPTFQAFMAFGSRLRLIASVPRGQGRLRKVWVPFFLEVNMGPFLFGSQYHKKYCIWGYMREIPKCVKPPPPM